MINWRLAVSATLGATVVAGCIVDAIRRLVEIGEGEGKMSGLGK